MAPTFCKRKTCQTTNYFVKLNKTEQLIMKNLKQKVACISNACKLIQTDSTNNGDSLLQYNFLDDLLRYFFHPSKKVKRQILRNK